MAYFDLLAGAFLLFGGMMMSTDNQLSFVFFRALPTFIGLVLATRALFTLYSAWGLA